MPTDGFSLKQRGLELGSQGSSFTQEPGMTSLSPRQAVAQILPFRDQNRKALDGLWNRHHVERVEIIMKETVDAKGTWVWRPVGLAPRGSSALPAWALVALQAAVWSASQAFAPWPAQLGGREESCWCVASCCVLHSSLS